MDELDQYIRKNLLDLMDNREKVAYRRIIYTQKKAEKAKGTDWAERTEEMLRAASNDPEIVSLSQNGYEGLVQSVKERILKQDGEKHYLNYCPRCGALARTPKAKQCPKCNFSWRERT